MKKKYDIGYWAWLCILFVFEIIEKIYKALATKNIIMKSIKEACDNAAKQIRALKSALNNLKKAQSKRGSKYHK